MRESSSPLWSFEPTRVNPIKLAYEPRRLDGTAATLTYASSPGSVTQNSPFVPNDGREEKNGVRLDQVRCAACAGAHPHS